MFSQRLLCWCAYPAARPRQEAWVSAHLLVGTGSLLSRLPITVSKAGRVAPLLSSLLVSWTSGHNDMLENRVYQRIAIVCQEGWPHGGGSSCVSSVVQCRLRCCCFGCGGPTASKDHAGKRNEVLTICALPHFCQCVHSKESAGYTGSGSCTFWEVFLLLMFWDFFGHFWKWYILARFWTFLEFFLMFLDVLGCLGTFWDALVCYDTFWDIFGHFGIC